MSRTAGEIWLGTLVLGVCLGCPTASSAQQSCVAPAPATLAPPAGSDTFTPEQEVYLGEIQAEQQEANFRVIHDDDLAAHLNDLVRGLLAKIPPTKLQFRVTLIDLPVINAFTLPGGRIYVTRKMVAFARNDDELASLLGHEMGHALTHQGAIRTTRLFREVLGVTSVGDRKDIFDKWNMFLDNVAHNPKTVEKLMAEEEPNQYEADQVGLYAMANAGYSPETFADFFDRSAQTNGKTGNWATDLFGATKPNEARLRQIRKAIGDLPATCRAKASPTPSPDFLAWQGRVIAYSGLGRREILSGLAEKKMLDPPLRDDLTRLRFSPDGRYVLAQDDASIFILSHDPFRLLFRVDARDAEGAEFTPDSKNVVFATRGLRVEEWNLDDQSRTAVHELTLSKGCLQSKLSPDGKTLACFNSDFDISLIDVASGSAVFEKKKYFQFEIGGPYEQHYRLMILLLESTGRRTFIRLEFSPDGRYFVAGGLGASIAYDLTSHAPVSMRGGLPERTRLNFVFVAPDQLVAANGFDYKDSGLYEFPSGMRLKQFALGTEQHLDALTRGGGNVAISPLKDAPAGIVDLVGRKVVIELKHSSAVDAYDRQFVLEQSSGLVGLFDMTSGNLIANLSLPQSPLSRLDAGVISEDLHWIALSGDRRGAVWNLSTAKRSYYMRGFRGAYFDGDRAFYAEFPKLEPQERSIVRADLDRTNLMKAETLDEKAHVRQWGRYLAEWKPGGKDQGIARNIVLDLRDTTDNHELWTRTFPKETPQMFFSASAGTLLIEWPVAQDAAMDEIKADPALRARLDSLRDRKGAYLAEVLDLATGKRLGAILIDTGKGSFDTTDGFAAGAWAGIAETGGRIQIYDISSGEEKGAVFGTRFKLSPAAGLLSVENQPGELDLYRLPSLEPQGQLIFSSPVSMQAFSEDGKRLCVLTEDQTVRTFNTSAIVPVKGSTATESATAK